MDATNEHEIIMRQYRHIVVLLLATAIPAGLAYALLGPWVTMLWLGAEQAPKDQLGFVLAGAGIVWMGLARLPSILSYSLARFRLWAGIASVEVAARLALTVALYPRFGYLAPLVALNVVHVCGIAAAYQWTGWRLLVGPREHFAFRGSKQNASVHIAPWPFGECWKKFMPCQKQRPSRK